MLISRRNVIPLLVPAVTLRGWLRATPLRKPTAGSVEDTAAGLVAELASQFVPESLKRVLSRHRTELRVGATLSLDDSGWFQTRRSVEGALVAEFETLGQILESKPRFGPATEKMGGLAALSLCLNLPEGNYARSDFELLLRYVRYKAGLFRIVIYDKVPDAASDRSGLDAMIAEIRERRRDLSRKCREAYPGAWSHLSFEQIDSRSMLHGVASLVFSHSVVDVVRIWTLAWKSAGGDISGMPERLNNLTD
ncbi:MAG: hypothetical protein AB1898_15175 [Acidobacteriota bacterium]